MLTMEFALEQVNKTFLWAVYTIVIKMIIYMIYNNVIVDEEYIFY